MSSVTKPVTCSINQHGAVNSEWPFRCWRRRKTDIRRNVAGSKRTGMREKWCKNSGIKWNIDALADLINMRQKWLNRSRFGFADHCARLEIIFTYLLIIFFQSFRYNNGLWQTDGRTHDDSKYCTALAERRAVKTYKNLKLGHMEWT